LPKEKYLKMPDKKIRSADALKNTLDYLRKKGKKVVFTNGCFDILHYGHVKYLDDAKKLGDVLVVAINTDKSVKNIKACGRPIINEKDRARVLSALTCVDFVTFFGEETPIKVIKALKPDILVKGADWHVSKIAGKDFVESYGGKVKTISYIKGYSTTSIINKIKALK